MKASYTVGNGKIRLKLDSDTFTEIEEDMNGVMDLMDPRIKIDGLSIEFDEKDLKSLNPVTFFNRSEHDEAKGIMNALNAVDYAVLFSTLFGYMAWLIYFITTQPNTPLPLLSIAALFTAIFAAGMYASVKSKLLEERRRQATYVKAKLVGYLYSTILNDALNDNNLLEIQKKEIEDRSKQQMRELKDMYNRLVPIMVKSQFGYLVPTYFPDGTPINKDIENNE